MQINVTARHVDLTAGIEEYVRRKCERLHKFYDRIQAIDVILNKAPNGFEVEVLADVEHHEDFVAKTEDMDLYTCVDQSIDKAARQLHDWKERIRDDRRHSGHDSR